VTSHRLYTCNLREARSARIGVRHQPCDVGGEIGPHHTVAHAPTCHGIGFREAVEQDGAIFEPRHRHDRVVLALEDQAAVNFIGEDHDIAVADGVREIVNLPPIETTASQGVWSY